MESNYSHQVQTTHIKDKSPRVSHPAGRLQEQIRSRKRTLDIQSCPLQVKEWMGAFRERQKDPREGPEQSPKECQPPEMLTREGLNRG